MFRLTGSLAQWWPTALAVAASVVGCGGRTDDVSAPGADASNETAMHRDGIAPEASDAADADSCITVLASDYDQSCSVDSDCAFIFQKPGCAPGCWNCLFVGINKTVYGQYRMALFEALAGGPPLCNCPALVSTACCRQGTCQTICANR
jgi:hypothetical protein